MRRLPQIHDFRIFGAALRSLSRAIRQDIASEKRDLQLISEIEGRSSAVAAGAHPDYFEDCPAYSRPMALHVELDPDGEAHVAGEHK